jgi:uncharacterized membrane protein YqjE
MADARTAGPLASLRAAGRTALEILSTRGELLSIEIAEEQARLAQLALYSALAVVAFGLAVQMAALTVVALFWDTPHRITAIVGVAALFAVAGSVCVSVFYLKLRAKPAPFSTSVDALKADIEALRAPR